MTTHRHRIPTVVAVLTVAFAAATNGALGSDNRGDYASPELIQLGSWTGRPAGRLQLHPSGRRRTSPPAATTGRPRSFSAATAREARRRPDGRKSAGQPPPRVT